MAEKSVSIDSEQLNSSVTTVMNTSKTNIQNRTKDKRPGTFILNSCSSVTFNTVIWLIFARLILAF